jgi:hypothetical protein
MSFCRWNGGALRVIWLLLTTHFIGPLLSYCMRHFSMGTRRDTRQAKVNVPMGADASATTKTIIERKGR